MALKVYYEADISKQNARKYSAAVLGYGSQGRAHVLNLRDSGWDVTVGQRAGSPRFEQAVADGFSPVPLAEAVGRGELVIMALPDEAMGEIFRAEVEPHLRSGQALGFLHGFAIRFGLITPPTGVDVVMVAPKGPGPLVRSAFERGGGLTSLFALHQDATGRAREAALAWGLGIGAGKGGLIETTFADECETDLFGEQTVLCGGVIELMKAAYETLVEAGYPAELAYIECVHELKQIVDMQYAEGLAAMRSKISRTAAYGGVTRGPRIVTEQTREAMRKILAEIRSGEFAREWVAEHQKGSPRLREAMREEEAHPMAATGKSVLEIVKKAVV